MTTERSAIGTLFSRAIPGGRLTLDSNLPAPIASKTAQTILYYLPYQGGLTPLWDGKRWVIWPIPTGASPLSLSLTSLSTGVHEIFIRWNNGFPALSAIAWGSNSQRNANAALSYKNGYLVSTNDQALLSLGCIYLDAVSKCEVSPERIHVSNRYNRIAGSIKTIPLAGNWAPNPNTIEPWGNRSGNTTIGLSNRFSIVNCEDIIITDVLFNGFIELGSVNIGGTVAIGLDSITAEDRTSQVSSYTQGVNLVLPARAFFKGGCGLGFHFLQALQANYSPPPNPLPTFTSNAGAYFIGTHYY
jgi:hypothetical protein